MTGNELSLLARGGPMMWVLGALALLLFTIFIERALFLHRGQIRAEAFIDGIRNILARRRLVEALTVCEETPGPVAAVVKAALLNADAPEERMRLQVQEAALNEIPVLERRIGALAVIAQVAPLVGILGTVLGMIATFAAFEQGGVTPWPPRFPAACGRRSRPPPAACCSPSPPTSRTISSRPGSGRSSAMWNGPATRS